MDQTNMMETVELVGRIERAMREGRAGAKGAPQTWGVALARGERDGQFVIMATTVGGERVPLTGALVDRLRYVMMSVQGSVPCVIDPHGVQPADSDAPLSAIEILCAISSDYANKLDYSPISQVLTPQALTYNRIVITSRKHPGGWPR